MNEHNDFSGGSPVNPTPDVPRDPNPQPIPPISAQAKPTAPVSPASAAPQAASPDQRIPLGNPPAPPAAQIPPPAYPPRQVPPPNAYVSSGQQPYGGPGYPAPPAPPAYGAYPPPPLPQVIYHTPEEPPAPPLQGLAIASMVLGIVSLALNCLCCGMISWLTSLIGLILGIVARAKGNKTGIGLAGIILNSVALLFTILLVALFAIGSVDFYDQYPSYWDGVYL